MLRLLTTHQSSNNDFSQDREVMFVEFSKWDKEYRVMANMTLLGDMVFPNTNLKLSQIVQFEARLSKGKGLPQFVFNPQGKGPELFNANTAKPLIRAILDMGMGRYSKELIEGTHSRLFDPYQGENDVLTTREFVGNESRYTNYKWNPVIGYVHSTPDPKSDHGKAWFSKHAAIDKLLMCLEINRPFVITLHEDDDKLEFYHKLGKMDITIVEALLAKSADIATAKFNANARVIDGEWHDPVSRNTIVVAAPVVVVVDGVTLNNVPTGEKVTIYSKYGQNVAQHVYVGGTNPSSFAASIKAGFKLSLTK